jgi:hypothetical protein
MNGMSLLRIVRLTCLNLVGIVGVFPDLAVAESEKTLRFDIASDCRTFNYTRGLPLDQIVRGDGFMISGKIFPADSLPTGLQGNDPTAPGSIGAVVARGTSTATLAEHLANPQAPGVFWTQYFMLNEGHMLVSEGWFAPSGANMSALVGGTGDFRGVGGEVFVTNVGTNSTGCPNARVTVVFEKNATKAAK